MQRVSTKKRVLKLRDVLEAMNERFNLLSLQLKQQNEKMEHMASRFRFLKSDVEELKQDQTDIQEGIFEIASDLARIKI